MDPQQSKDRLERVEALLEDLHERLVGKLGADGLVTRVAKLEQRQSLLAGVLAAVGTAFLGVLTTWILKR